jgi:hypothetical protein
MENLASSFSYATACVAHDSPLRTSRRVICFGFLLTNGCAAACYAAAQNVSEGISIAIKYPPLVVPIAVRLTEAERFFADSRTRFEFRFQIEFLIGTGRPTARLLSSSCAASKSSRSKADSCRPGW